MENEKIISKSNDPYEAMTMAILQTYKVFADKLKEEPNASVAMSMYCRDIGFLLSMLNKAGEELHDKGRIIT